MNSSVSCRFFATRRASFLGIGCRIKSKIFTFLILSGFVTVSSTVVLSQNARSEHLLPVKTLQTIHLVHSENESGGEASGVDEKTAASAVNYFMKANAFDASDGEINSAANVDSGRQTAIEKIFSGLTGPGTMIKGVDRRTNFGEDDRSKTGIDSFAPGINAFGNCLEKGAFRALCGGRSSTNSAKAGVSLDAADDPNADKPIAETERGFNWGAAIEQSLLFLAVQHGYALTQPKTRSALKGNFFGDYVKSVKSLHGWGDGGRFFTNYIAHPMQGAFTGYIQIHNDPKGKRQRFGNSSDYWKSRMKALGWSALWSTQFEIGPISQASIGNVGLSGKQTWVDIVITPTVGTAMLITEDALDRFVIERLERRTDNYYLMVFSRMLLNPTRTMANLIRFKLPWYRDRGRMRP